MVTLTSGTWLEGGRECAFLSPENKKRRNDWRDRISRSLSDHNIHIENNTQYMSCYHSSKKCKAKLFPKGVSFYKEHGNINNKNNHICSLAIQKRWHFTVSISSLDRTHYKPPIPQHALSLWRMSFSAEGGQIPGNINVVSRSYRISNTRVSNQYELDFRHLINITQIYSATSAEVREAGNATLWRRRHDPTIESNLIALLIRGCHDSSLEVPLLFCCCSVLHYWQHWLESNWKRDLGWIISGTRSVLFFFAVLLVVVLLFY